MPEPSINGIFPTPVLFTKFHRNWTKKEQKFFDEVAKSTTQNTGVVTYVAVFGPNNPQRTNTSNTTAITEAGIFNSSTAALGGTMLCHTTFNAVNKGNDDTLQITWTITVS